MEYRRGRITEEYRRWVAQQRQTDREPAAPAMVDALSVAPAASWIAAAPNVVSSPLGQKASSGENVRMIEWLRSEVGVHPAYRGIGSWPFTDWSPRLTAVMGGAMDEKDF